MTGGERAIGLVCIQGAYRGGAKALYYEGGDAIEESERDRGDRNGDGQGGRWHACPREQRRWQGGVQASI